MGNLEYQVKLPIYEGPFEALFHLIQKAEVDIHEISLAKITDDYIAYLEKMEEFNLEIASEFIVMAATLLKIKSQRMLPLPSVAEPIEEDELFTDISTQEELIARIVEYNRFQEISNVLRECEDSQKRIFIRSFGEKKSINPEDNEEFYEKSTVSLSNLFTALQNVLSDVDVKMEEIPRDKYSVSDIIKEINQKINRSGSRGLKFSELFSLRESKIKVILIFFSLLELIRRRKIKVWQEKSFSDIYLNGVTNTPNSTREDL